MFKKLISLAALALCMGSAWADSEDVTSTYLTNAGFDTESSWQTSNVAAGGSANCKDVDGWTGNGGAAWSSSAAFGFGGTGQINGAAVPSTNSDGAAKGGCLGLSVGWSGTSLYTQTATLPKGVYKLTYAAYNAGTKTQATNKIGVTVGSTNYYGNTSSFTVGTWITESIDFELSEETSCTFSVGITAVSGGSGDNAKLLVDYIKLEKTTIDVSALTAEITKAKDVVDNSTSDDKETINAAITAAQAIADSPESLAQVAEAVTTLETALQTYEMTEGNEPNEGYTFDMTFKVGDIYNTSSWSYTTGAQNHAWKESTTKNHDDYVATGFYENWKGSNFSGQIYTTLTGLRAGHYKVTALAFDNVKSGAVSFYAGDESAALSTETELFQQPTVEDVIVGESGKLEVGLDINEASTNWVGISTVNLYYTGSITDEEKCEALYDEIKSTIAAINAMIPTANIGSEPFQYNEKYIEEINSSM